MMLINIHVFAALRDYFDHQFSIEVNNNTTVGQLLARLGSDQADSFSILSKCRFAVNEEFVSQDYVIKNGENIFILPPSSGG